MKFLLYEGRHGERVLMKHSRESWDQLMLLREQDDRCTLDDASEMDLWVDGGTFEEGYVSVDDGGKISTIELTPTIAWTNG